LQKVLARAGLASRREAEDWIRAMRLTVNGQIATLGVRVGPNDQVRLDGRLIRQRATPRSGSAFICHRSPGESLQKPAEIRGSGDADAVEEGVEHDGGSAQDRADADRRDAARPERGAGHAARDSVHAPVTGRAVTDRLPRRAGRRFIAVSPMPRIDGGLELVTSDGELAAKLQRSVKHLTSEFSVRVRGELDEDQVARILQGTLDSGETLQVERCEPSGGEASNRWYTVVARGASGKDVRQLFERQAALVSRVLRTKLGPIALERTLARGRFRELTEEELDAITAPPAGGNP
jgi:23S rRNA pseudouridine2605 synthase